MEEDYLLKIQGIDMDANCRTSRSKIDIDPPCGRTVSNVSLCAPDSEKT